LVSGEPGQGGVVEFGNFENVVKGSAYSDDDARTIFWAMVQDCKGDDEQVQRGRDLLLTHRPLAAKKVEDHFNKN